MPTVFDPADIDLAKIILIPTVTGKRGELDTRLTELELQFVQAESA